MRRPARPSLAVLLAALTASCASASSARRAELRRALDQVRLSRPPGEIWPEVQRFVNQRGYPLVGEDRAALGKPAQASVAKLFSIGFQTRIRKDGSRVLETDPRGDTRIRVRVEAFPGEGGGTRLRVRMIQHAEMSTVDISDWRDEDFELALVEYIDPVAGARVTGHQPPQPVPPVSGDPWAPVRPLLGAWSGALADGSLVRWRFDLASDSQSVEMHGTPILFVGPAVRASGEELGRISHAPGAGLVWNQFTNAGRVDRYAAPATPRPDEPLVFVGQSLESLPAAARAPHAAEDRRPARGCSRNRRAQPGLRRCRSGATHARTVALPGQEWAAAADQRRRRSGRG